MPNVPIEGVGPLRLSTIACVIMICSGSANAFKIETDNPYINLRWDDSVKYTFVYGRFSAEEGTRTVRLGRYSLFLTKRGQTYEND